MRLVATDSAKRSNGGNGPCSAVGISRWAVGSERSSWLDRMITRPGWLFPVIGNSPWVPGQECGRIYVLVRSDVTTTASRSCSLRSKGPGELTSRRAPRSLSILSVARRYIPMEWVGEPEEERVEYRHGRPGKLDSDRYLLRGSRLGQARRVGPRVAAERCFLGEAGDGLAECGSPGHHLRPPGVRAVQQAVDRLQLRHVRRGSAHARDEARAARFRPRRLLDGRRRGGPLHRQVWLGPREQGGVLVGGPAVPIENGRQPTGGRRGRLRWNQGGDRRGPPRVSLPIPVGFFQCRRLPGKARQRSSGPVQLEYRGRRFAPGHPGLRYGVLLDGLPERLEAYRCSDLGHSR